jgi:hypothetical protein
MTLRSPGVPKSAYYVALDGLRAIAVIMVFFQHYGAGHALCSVGDGRVSIFSSFCPAFSSPGFFMTANTRSTDIEHAVAPDLAVNKRWQRLNRVMVRLLSSPEDQA